MYIRTCTDRLVLVALSAQPPGVNELCVCVCVYLTPSRGASKTGGTSKTLSSTRSPLPHAAPKTPYGRRPRMEEVCVWRKAPWWTAIFCHYGTADTGGRTICMGILIVNG
jgi:hypothetical protein